MLPLNPMLPVYYLNINLDLTSVYMKSHAYTCIHTLNLQGRSSSAAWKKVRDVFWSALLWNWIMWGPAQYINMSYVPLQVNTSEGLLQ